MSRVPFDIEFLLEGILDESPDTVRVGDTTHEWTDPDSYSFMIFDTFSVIARNMTHYNIMTNLSKVAHSRGAGEYVLRLFTDRKKMLVSDEAAAVAELKNPISLLNKYFVKYKNYDAEVRYRTRLGLTGRLWTRSKVISFWNSYSEVKSKWTTVQNMFEKFPRRLGVLEEYQIDFIERANSKNKPLEPVQSMRVTDPNQTNFMKDLFGGEEKLNNKQIRALQQKIHTLPPEKKKAALDMLGVKNYKASEIANKLGISVAEFNHLMQVNEIENLTEDPDGVYNTYGQKVTRWYTSEAFAFYIFDRCTIFCRGGTHFEIAEELLGAANDGDPETYIKNSENDIIVSDFDEFVKELNDENSTLAKLIAHYKDGMAVSGVDDIHRIPDDYIYDARTDFGICGRVWPSKGYISFWNTQSQVLKNWSAVERMFKQMPSYLGKLESYMVDGVERDEDGYEEEMIPAKKISANTSGKKGHTKSDDKQMSLFDSLFGKPSSLPQLTDKQKNVVRRKLHVLPPEEKQKALKLMGVKNVKAIEIATKLGMTVAEFNHLMQINEENVPSLGEILKEIQDKKL